MGKEFTTGLLHCWCELELYTPLEERSKWFQLPSKVGQILTIAAETDSNLRN